VSVDSGLRAPPSRSPATVAAIPIAAALILGILVSRYSVATVAVYGLIAVFAASFVFVIVRADPVVSFTAALLLGIFSGNWEGVGLPGILSPNRIVLVLAVLAVLFRVAPSAKRPQLRVQPVHWLMIAAGVYAVLSAALSRHLVANDSIADLGERFGLLPMLACFVLPAVFRTQRDRNILLAALVGLGGYLGLTAFFEAAGLDAFVFPSYINDPQYGVLVERARGPFADPIANAMAMFACAGACVIALGTWRSASARFLAAATALSCFAGILFTLTRGAWLGAAVASILMLAVVPELRRRAIPLALAALVCLGVALVAIPGLNDDVTERRTTQGTVYDRLALNRGALNMFEERPLTGFGWYTWQDHNVEFLQQGDDYPLPDGIQNFPVHNLYLGFLAELGLIGTGLWLAAMVAAVGGAILRRGSRDILPWRYLLLAVAVFYLSITNFAPTTTFPIFLLLFLTGVVNGGSPSWAFVRPLRAAAHR
jgi:putative inorganic carbon (hco3(-)) transporter